MTGSVLDARQRALVIDDDETSRDFFTLFLRQHGLEVDVANDGLTALNLLRAHHYALAICDVRMPQVDGISVVRNMMGHANRCPILLVTSHEDPSFKLRAKEVGSQLLVKPISARQLELALESLIDASH
jgi:DNA-binding response OmpR family regulator